MFAYFLSGLRRFSSLVVGYPENSFKQRLPSTPGCLRSTGGHLLSGGKEELSRIFNVFDVTSL